MDRLTEKDYEQYLIKGLSLIGLNASDAYILEAVTNKLAEYENSKLEPRDCQDIYGINGNIIKFVMEKRELNNKYNTLLEMYDKKQEENKKLQQERDDAVKKYENMKYRILHMFGADETK